MRSSVEVSSSITPMPQTAVAVASHLEYDTVQSFRPYCSLLHTIVVGSCKGSLLSNRTPTQSWDDMLAAMQQ
jgi:hypothetical protein